MTGVSRHAGFFSRPAGREFVVYEKLKELAAVHGRGPVRGVGLWRVEAGRCRAYPYQVVKARATTVSNRELFVQRRYRLVRWLEPRCIGDVSSRGVRGFFGPAGEHEFAPSAALTFSDVHAVVAAAASLCGVIFMLAVHV